ncbi:hypothetical protein SERLA73DRAFT_149626 [Serpula lacrymans var. lacrymans S7.3]|uniref:Uncharacterized protein n=1 Tax=Serpula lacrymans var. lacrymans (strain S7.3) TaxID=936435 RepID=F8PJN7_SERL3|nr:hypothetical protein SERLA73DRAFT_149626 [Serpula lacrymans var. lacrymans S7.3]
MVAPRSKSTDEEQEEIKGLDEILSNDEHGADIQNQPGPSKPAARDMTTAIEDSLESTFLDKTRPPLRMVTRALQSPTKCGQEEMDEEPGNIAHRTRSGSSPVKRLQQAKDTKSFMVRTLGQDAYLGLSKAEKHEAVLIHAHQEKWG